MPRKAIELKPVQVNRLTKPGLHAVGGVAGLQLQVKQSGARSWILRAQIGAKRRDIGLGGYPDVTLASARERAREAKELIRQGIDPVEARKTARQALIAAQARQLSFSEAAAQCHAKKAPEFRNSKHASDWINSLTRYADPVIGKIPVAQIELAQIVSVLEPIWLEKTETATRVRQRIESVLAWAKVSGYRSGDNPARWKGNLDQVLPKPSKVRQRKHFAALPWQEIGSFMVELRKREGIAARALEFLILTAARSGEIRFATWDEVCADSGVWTIPAQRMKAGKAHRIPLSQEAIKLLRQLPQFEGSPYLFTSPRGGVLSDMSISSVCRRMQVDAVPHGFRSTFKDWARTCTAYADEISELALAHVSSDATRAAYARDELLPQRQRMMTDWAIFCESPWREPDVIPIRAAWAAE